MDIEVVKHLNSEPVQIVDSALPDDLYAYALAYSKSYPMRYGWRNTSKSPREFWHQNFVLPGTYKHHYAEGTTHPDLNYENFMKNFTPFSATADFIRNKYFNGTPMTRVWMNVQTFGNEGDIHRDFDLSYYKNTRSAILYLQESWDIDWGGDLAIFDEQGEILKSVLVKPNRLVVFNGCLRHSVRPLSRFSTEPRRALVFACEIIK